MVPRPYEYQLKNSFLSAKTTISGHLNSKNAGHNFCFCFCFPCLDGLWKVLVKKITWVITSRVSRGNRHRWCRIKYLAIHPLAFGYPECPSVYLRASGSSLSTHTHLIGSAQVLSPVWGFWSTPYSKTSTSSSLKMQSVNYPSCFFPEEMGCPWRISVRSLWERNEEGSLWGPQCVETLKCQVSHSNVLHEKIWDIRIMWKGTLKRLKLSFREEWLWYQGHIF